MPRALDRLKPERKEIIFFCSRSLLAQAHSPHVIRVPFAMTDDRSFQSLGLRDELLSRLQQMAFTQMTTVQAAALPSASEGNDVVAQASTGSGKTAVFALPVCSVWKTHNSRFSLWCFARLASWQSRWRRTFASWRRHLANTKVTTLCGGVAIGPQIGSLQHSAHVVVGTPGRVLKHLQKAPCPHGLNCLVLDEADRMLDMGFEDEIDTILLLSADAPSESAFFCHVS